MEKLTLLFLVLLSFPSYADIIELHNGDRISGQLKKITSGSVTFISNYNATLDIKLDQVKYLTSDHRNSVLLNSGEIVIGKFNLNNKGILNISSANLGVVKIKLAEINTISIAGSPRLSQKRMSTIHGAGATKHETKAVNKNQEPIGIKPEEDIRKVFLRRSGILLDMGQQQLDVGLSYKANVVSGVRQRSFTIPLSYRYGLSDKTELSLALPIGWAQSEAVTTSGFVRNEESGIGDVTIGAYYHFIDENAEYPDIIGNIRVNAPTADKPDLTNPFPVSLGSGFWSLSAGLSFVRSYDPVVLFGGFEFRHTFNRSFASTNIQPGDIFSFNFGSSFAVNQDISLSGQFVGAYQTEGSIDGKTIDGSSRDPWFLKSALTYRMKRGYYLEPSVNFGLNEDATDTAVNLTYSHKF